MKRKYTRRSKKLPTEEITKRADLVDPSIIDPEGNEFFHEKQVMEAMEYVFAAASTRSLGGPMVASQVFDKALIHARGIR